MAVTCAACGKESQDVEFCDHCNADLSPLRETRVPARCPLVPGLVLSPVQQSLLSHPEASLVLTTPERSWRVHWLGNPAWERWRPHVDRRQQYFLSALPLCSVVKESGGVWLGMETTNRRYEPWKHMWSADPREDLRYLAGVLDVLAGALHELHEHGLVWLTFDPQELEEVPAAGKGSPGLRFTNLDLEVFKARECPERLQVPPSFAAPEAARFKADDVGPATSVYHLGLFAYYWIAKLLPRGFAGQGLEAFGFRLPPVRTFRPSMPPGVTAVLERALALEPRHRFAMPADFCQALRQCLERVASRYTSTTGIRWEIGSHSRTGRTKEALRQANEDHVFTRTFAAPDRAVVAVADGISSCHVGSGALASWMTALVLENTFNATCTRDAFPKLIRGACRKSATMLLEWGLEKGYKEQLLAGLDLMGTTLTAGWLEGNRLSLANAGDSRAYLIVPDFVEQLTVDGDLASELLASGTPPEEVRELGGLARALRVCIGGCMKNPAGQLTILEDFCRPAMSFWPLLPGDVIVLCSDGLIEEGAFLEPSHMAEIVRKHRDLPAEELALRLAEASDVLHRLPSVAEPDGFGDNISCVVVKIDGLNA